MTKFETVPYFSAAKFETVLPCQDKVWNGPIFCSCKIWDRFAMSKIKTLVWINLKRSHILQQQNLRPFYHVRTKFKTVPYFAAAKFETVLTCQFKIWNYHILQPWNLRPFHQVKNQIPCHDKNSNGPIFCSRKIWDRFTMSCQILKWSYILQPQNLGWFHDVRTKFETVPYFLAATFETCSQKLKWSHILHSRF